jgi:hypothetical protein
MRFLSIRHFAIFFAEKKTFVSFSFFLRNKIRTKVKKGIHSFMGRIVGRELLEKALPISAEASGKDLASGL